MHSIVYKILLWLIISQLLAQTNYAQQVYTLQEVIEIAKSNSLVSLQAQNRKENRFWQYRTYLSNYKPQLFLNGTLPDFSRAIVQNRNDDGSISFINISNLNMDATLSLRQTIAATGGEISISTGLGRLDNLSGSLPVQYSSNLIQIGFSQPVFTFNELKWDRKVEPLRYEESLKAYNEDLENISVQVADLFFNLLDAQIAVEIASKNLANNDTIYRIGEKRFELGKIAENDLLQLKLNLMNSTQQLTQARLEVESSQLALRAYLGKNEDYRKIRLIAPEEAPVFTIDPQKALNQAKANREQYVIFKRQKLEARRDLARAKGEGGLNLNVFGSFGLTQRAENVLDAYQSPQNQQSLTIGFEIPILDWGRQKSRIKTALANRELIESTISQDSLNFEQEIYLKVRQLEILRERLQISKETDKIAQRRYFIAQQRYLNAKISITDLNIALQEKDASKQNFLSAMRSFWKSYYEIRQLTLYDFEKDQVINNK